MTTADRHPSLRLHIRARRTELGDLSQGDLAAKAGVVRNTVAKLEKGLKLEESAETKIERALGWRLGSIDAIRGGGEPTLLEAGETTMNPPMRRDVNTDALASMLLVTHERRGFLPFRDMLSDLSDIHDEATMDAIMSRYNEMASGEVGETHHA